MKVRIIVGLIVVALGLGGLWWYQRSQSGPAVESAPSASGGAYRDLAIPSK